MIRDFFPYRIWQQIFCLLVFVLVLPIIVLGLGLMNTSQNAIRQAVTNDYDEIAVHVAGEINNFIEIPLQTLTVTSSILGKLHDNPWQQETVLIDLALNKRIFNRVSTIGLDGLEMASSELGSPLRNHTEDEAFHQAKKGKTYISEVRMSENGIPTLTLAVPIKQQGRIRGVLSAEVNLRSIWTLVDAIKIGDTGRALLIDRDGRLLAHTDKKMVLNNTKPFAPEVIKEFLVRRRGNLETVDPSGQKVLVAYAPIEKVGWGAVIVKPVEEAFAPVAMMRIQSWGFVILSIFTTVLISFILSQVMSRPINRLIEATQHVARDDLDYMLPAKRTDEIGQLFASFNQMTAKVKEARHLERLSVVGKAATAIAHELKNALVLVNTYIHLLPQRHKDEAFVDEFSRIVPQELDSWNKMLRNMVDYSKFYQFQTGDVDLNSLIKDVAALAYYRARQNEIEFIFKSDDNLPTVKGNADKLKQVFLNLVNNAIEVTPKGGSITVTTTVDGSGQAERPAHVRIQVEDTGGGISHENLQRIFEPFYTTKPTGLGLGLSISKEIVEGHGGRIEVFNRSSRGARFTVLIPVGSSGESFEFRKDRL